MAERIRRSRHVTSEDEPSTSSLSASEEEAGGDIGKESKPTQRKFCSISFGKKKAKDVKKSSRKTTLVVISDDDSSGTLADCEITSSDIQHDSSVRQKKVGLSKKNCDHSKSDGSKKRKKLRAFKLCNPLQFLTTSNEASSNDSLNTSTDMGCVCMRYKKCSSTVDNFYGVSSNGKVPELNESGLVANGRHKTAGEVSQRHDVYAECEFTAGTIVMRNDTLSADDSDNPPCTCPGVGAYPKAHDSDAIASSLSRSMLADPPAVHTQVDYAHFLVPDLLKITQCGYYHGVMDRYEAERLLENKPEGTFLLRDSAQEDFLFSVSFRRYGRSLHARVELDKHKFSFDSHDPGVYTASTVVGLLEHFKDPNRCMFFEPLLTIPLKRTFPFSLQHLCRATIGSRITYDGISQLNLPKALKSYLKFYHYKQQVRVRRYEVET